MRLKYNPTTNKYAQEHKNIIVLSNLRKIQQLLSKIKRTCENRNEEVFPYDCIQQILALTKDIEESLILKDVPVDYFTNVVNSNDISKIFREIKEDLLEEKRKVKDKQDKYREVSELL